MKVGIYNHQHLRGGCPGCSQTYVKGMVSDAQKCQALANRLYGADCEFLNYTDLGDYPSDHVDRPGYKRMIEDIKKGELDVVISINARKISSQMDLILGFYELCKTHRVDFLTVADGKDIMPALDILLAKPQKTQV